MNAWYPGSAVIGFAYQCVACQPRVLGAWCPTVGERRVRQHWQHDADSLRTAVALSIDFGPGLLD